MLTFIWVTLGSILGAYALYTLLLFISQDIFIFPKPKPNYLTYKRLASSELHFTTQDGISLQGWKTSGFLPLTEANKIIIYFGGNGQDTSSMMSIFQEFDVSTIFTFNYRGYGLSEGKPSEKNLTKDALEIFDFVQSNNPNSEIIVMGHSLGSAIAGYVARHKHPSKLILLCPLHSISKIASENFHILKYLVRHPVFVKQVVAIITLCTLNFDDFSFRV